jgi:hypothetical protein
MPSQPDFTPIFQGLKSILQPFAPKLNVTTNTKEAYSIDGPYSGKWKRDLFFASVQVKKNYVSFYLMPVYMYPDLLEGISPELKKRMQGKSCFNFRNVDPDLFEELAVLTKKGYKKFVKAELK